VYNLTKDIMSFIVFNFYYLNMFKLLNILNIILGIICYILYTLHMKQQKSTAKIRNNEEYSYEYVEKAVSYETNKLEFKKKNGKSESGLMNFHNKRIGILGEDFAVEYLEKLGLVIFERNFAVKFGEIDIVAVSYETKFNKSETNDNYSKNIIGEKIVKKVCIIEVKTSVIRDEKSLSAIDNLTFKKLRKVAKVGEFYVKEKFSHETPFSICACLVYLNLDLSLNKVEYISDIEIY
jgi:Holliday junction resolvase-like predicted endonuclease